MTSRGSVGLRVAAAVWAVSHFLAGCPSEPPPKPPPPPGIALAQDGALSGAATVAGDFSIKLVVKDGADQSVRATYPLKVHAAPEFDTTALPGATAGSDYVARLEAFIRTAGAAQ